MLSWGFAIAVLLVVAMGAVYSASLWLLLDAGSPFVHWMQRRKVERLIAGEMADFDVRVAELTRTAGA